MTIVDQINLPMAVDDNLRSEHARVWGAPLMATMQTFIKMLAAQVTTHRGTSPRSRGMQSPRGGGSHMDSNERTLRIAAVASYVVASVMLIAGLGLTVSLVTGASRTVGLLDTFGFLGLGPLAQILARPLQAALITAGIVSFVVSVIISGLLYGLGSLCGVIRQLSLRVTTLGFRSKSEG